MDEEIAYPQLAFLLIRNFVHPISKGVNKQKVIKTLFPSISFFLSISLQEALTSHLSSEKIGQCYIQSVFYKRPCKRGKCYNPIGRVEERERVRREKKNKG